MKKNTRMYGGKQSDYEYMETEVFTNMAAALSDDDRVNQYLKDQKLSSEKNSLLRFIFSKKSDPDFDDFFDKMKKRQLNMRDVKQEENPEYRLYQLLDNKLKAKDAIKNIKTQLNTIKGIDEKTRESAIRTLEDGSAISMTTVSEKTANALKNGSLFMASIFASDNKNQSNRNENNIDILFYDQEHHHYRKGDSIPKDDKLRFGDFMIVDRPTKYSGMRTFLGNMSDSVEDLLSVIATSGENLLCTSNDEKCKKYTVYRKPYKTRSIKIVNEQESE